MAVRQGSPELLDVPGIVSQQDIALELLGCRPGVMLQAVYRQRHPFWLEQEQLLAPQVSSGFVNGRSERGITQVQRFPAGADPDPGTCRGQAP